MRAAVFTAPSRVSVISVDTPACPAGGLLTRVLACAICGSDLRLYEHGPFDRTSVHGHESVMSVVETNPDVTGFQTGERIMLCPVTCGTCSYCLEGRPHLCVNKNKVRSVVQGGYAEYRPIGQEAIRGGFLLRIPPDLDTPRATVIEPLSCVLCGSDKLSIYPGKTVAIIGAGPIGNLHLQMAKLRGAKETVLIDVLQHRLEYNAALKPTHMLNASEQDPVKAVNRITGGRGAEIVIVACVSSEAQQQALEMASRGGEVCFFAALPPDAHHVPLDTNLIHNHELSVLGSRSSGRRHFERAMDLIRSGKIDAGMLLTHCLPLDRIDEGFRLAKSGEAMKVVLTP